MQSAPAVPIDTIDEVVRLFEGHEIQTVEGSILLQSGMHDQVEAFFNRLELPVHVLPEGSNNAALNKSQVRKMYRDVAPCAFECGYFETSGDDLYHNFDLHFGAMGQFATYAAKFKEIKIFPNLLQGISLTAGSLTSLICRSVHQSANPNQVNDHGTYLLLPSPEL